MTSAPAYDNGRVYVTLDDDLLQAWNAVDGSRSWTVSLPGRDGVERHVVAANGVVVVTDGISSVSGLSQVDGHVLWTHPVEPGGRATATVAGDQVITAEAFGDNITSYDLATGELHWTGAPFTCGQAANSVAASGDSIYLSAPCEDRQLDAATGAVIATAAGSGPLTVSGTGLASIVDGHVEWQAAFGAIPNWTSAADDYVSSVLSDGRVVVATTADGRVDSLSATTGELIASAPRGDMPAPTLNGLPNGGVATMMATANTLVVPYGRTLRAYRDTGSEPPIAAAAPSAPSVDLSTIPTPAFGTSWTTIGGNTRHDGNNPGEQTTGHYVPIWQQDYVTPAALPDHGLGPNVSTPVIVPGGVFVVGIDDSFGAALYSYQPLTGLPLWPPVPLGSCTTHSPSLTYSNGILVARSGAGCDPVVAVAAATGTVLWQESSSADIPEAADGRLYIGPYAYTLATGERVGPLGLMSYGAPVIDAGAVYTSSACDHVYKWEAATLRNLWTVERRQCTGPSSTPQLGNGLIRYREPDSSLELNPATGALIDSSPAQVAPASSGELVVINDGNRLVAEQAASRRIVWTYTMATTLAFRPTIAGTHVVAIDLDGNLVVLDARSGQLLESIAAPLPSVRGDRENSLAAAQGLLVYPSRLGITVLRADDGITSLLPPALPQLNASPDPIPIPIPTPVPQPTPTPRPAPTPSVTHPTPSTSPISVHYAALGGLKSALGGTVGSEYAISGGRGRNYQHGQIFSSTRTGAFEVVGDIDTRYRAVGGPRGSLGFPTSDDKWTAKRAGHYARFSGGSIYWSRTTGARIISGPIFTKWSTLGAEHGRLGYPTSDVRPIAGGLRTTFQHGVITYTSKTKKLAVVYH